MALFLMEKKFGVIITPIEALGEDQVAACARLKLRAVMLTEESVHDNGDLLASICRGEYDMSTQTDVRYLCESNR